MFAISASEYESSKLPDFYHKLFRAVENDPKFTRLDYLQEYSQKLKARNERSEEVYKRTRRNCPSSQVPTNQRCRKNLSV